MKISDSLESIMNKDKEKGSDLNKNSKKILMQKDQLVIKI